MMTDYYLDRDKLAQKLSVPASTIDYWRKCKENPLPVHLIGKHKRYVWPEVVAWVERENGQTS